MTLTRYMFPAEYLKPALLVSLLSVWVLVGLFFYLNLYTRRRYFKIWSGAWLFYALWLTLSLTMHAEAEQPLLLMLKPLCVGLAALFVIWGGCDFQKQVTSDRLIGLFVAFLVVWSYVGAYWNSEQVWAQFTVFAMIGFGSALVAYGFYRTRSDHVGASLLALGFLLWGGYLACYPLWQSSPQMIASGFCVSAVLQLFIAVSMIILVLEEVRTTHQQTLQQVQRQKSEAQNLRTRILATEERYRSLFAQASEAIVITTATDLRILDLNEAARRLFGVPEANDGSHSLTSFLRLGTAPLARRPGPDGGVDWFTALTGQHRIEVVHADGTAVPAEVAGAPVAFEGATAYQFFVRVVTEKARLEQQLRQAEKLSALGQMISGVAHELNNPLAVVKGYLDLILTRSDLGKQTRTDLEKVAHESDRAAKLVRNFLSFARQRPSHRERVNLNQLVQRVLELREMEMRAVNVQAILHLDPDLPETEAEPAELEQVLVNLVGNALHALSGWRDGRRLKISTVGCHDVIVIEVQDSGPGIPPDVVPHIFEPFFTTKEVGSGTGLGLSIAHSIVAEHHGKIYYQPSVEGGARFIVELPVVQPNPQAEAAEELAGSASEDEAFVPIAGAPARVLILDDEPVLAELLAEVVANLGHSPVTCCSGAAALQILQEQAFDVIFSDFRMPQMNGRQFYERLNELQPDSAKRVIFLTGDVLSQDTRAFMESMGNRHLPKPFRLDQIASIISEMLQHREVCPADCDAAMVPA